MGFPYGAAPPGRTQGLGWRVQVFRKQVDRGVLAQLQGRLTGVRRRRRPSPSFFHTNSKQSTP